MRTGKKDIAAGVLFIALIAAFILTVNSMTASSGEREIQLVQDAVKNAALTCYAVEGRYPETLEYLQEHYRLAFNDERYIVEYDAFADNMMPSISVLERGKDEP